MNRSHLSDPKPRARVYRSTGYWVAVIETYPAIVHIAATHREALDWTCDWLKTCATASAS